MGYVAALVGTLFVWISVVGQPERIALWPAMLATVGFWALAALYHQVRKQARRR